MAKKKNEEKKAEIIEETANNSNENDLVADESSEGFDEIEDIEAKELADDTEEISYVDDDEANIEAYLKAKNELEANSNEEREVPVAGKNEVIAEVEVKPLAQQKKEARESVKAEKRQQRDYNKMVKQHRKKMKTNPDNLIRYNTDPETGLSYDVVEKRKLDNLVNKTETKTTKTIGKIICDNVFTFFNILTITIGVILIYFQRIQDCIFLIIVTANIVIGCIQEIRAKKTIDRLSLMSAPSAIVKRNGVIHEISVSEVVLDDLLLLESGRQICADSIVVEGQVEVNESLLTGESDAIVKKPGDQLLSGSFIVSGKCSARVDKIGKDNYIESLSNQAKRYQKPKSDLLFSLNLIIKVMAVIIIPIGGFLWYRMVVDKGIPISWSMFVYNSPEYNKMIEVVSKTGGAMIGMIPSGLILMASIALAVGVIKLAERNVLVQELYCIEMLARVNCICLDKTGTITDGTMSVKNVIDYNTVYGLATKNIISAMLNALQDTNMTSTALKEKFGLGKRIKHIGAIPFSSQRKYQAVTFDKYGTFILGAPEFVIKDDFYKIKKDVDKYASLGYRVLCLAHREGTIQNNQLPDVKPEVVSMILIEDNIRPDAINTIKYFRESGVQVRVISGDNPLTVSKIAQRAGIERAEEYISLDGMADSEVIQAATKYTVFGRVSPAQKKLLVQTLKSTGLTVAMTGDGVNDILALKEADCSIAVASGSDAARNMAHLVLLDSNFDSMPKVVAEGRRVINNVTSVASLFLTKTIFSLLLSIEALIVGTYPISPIQLAIIDFLGIGLPSFFLVMEPNNNPISGKFLPNVIKKALPGAIVILIISIIVFALNDTLNLDQYSLQTIICIAATHTSMMVLFKTCKPFNTVRKFLCGGCYAGFLFCILVMPFIFEFRPIFSWAEYYSKTYQTEVISSYPKIEKSKKNLYIIDGIVTTIPYQGENTSSTDISCELVDGQYYYTVNNGDNKKRTDVFVNIPKLTLDTAGELYLGGYLINDVSYKELNNLNLSVDSKGIVSIGGKEVTTTLTRNNSYYNFYKKYDSNNADYVAQKTVTYCVLPTVKVINNQYYINGKNEFGTDEKYYYYANAAYTNLEVSMNPNTWELLINGLPIYPYDSMGNQIPNGSPYVISKPRVTTDCKVTNGHLSLIFDAVDTGVNLFTSLYTDGVTYDDNPITSFPTLTNGLPSNSNGFKDSANQYITYDNFEIIPEGTDYYINVIDKDLKKKTNISLSNSNFSIEVGKTEENHLIIDGYYTDYLASTRNSQVVLSVNSDKYLVVDNVTTNFKIANSNIISNKNENGVLDGGIVKILNATEKIFLLMLCLLAAPAMKIIQGIVPWIKKQIKFIAELLSKF